MRPLSSKWSAPIARPWRCFTGLGEPPGTELSLRWRPRRLDCCAPMQPRLKPSVAAQVEALRRLRNGGSQTVPVEHVHVNEGGQAVIGNVRSGTTGPKKGSTSSRDEQHEERLNKQCPFYARYAWGVAMDLPIREGVQRLSTTARMSSVIATPSSTAR